MTLLNKASEFKKFDVRVIERHLNRGVLSTTDIEKSIKALEDDSDNAEYISIEEIAADETGSN